MLRRNVLLTIKEALWAEVALPVQGALSFALQCFGSGYMWAPKVKTGPVGRRRCPDGHLNRGILGATSTLELQTLN